MGLVARILVGLLLWASFIRGSGAQSPADFINGVGQLVQSGIRAATQAEWEKRPGAEISCVDQQLRQTGKSINSIIGQGIGPSDSRIAGILNACRGTSDASSVAGGPSFNCDSVSRTDEIAICSDSELSRLDRIVAAGYEYLRARYGAAAAQSVAAPLLRQRQACGSEVECIRRAQMAAIGAFQARGAPGLPYQPGGRGGVAYTVDGLQLGNNVVMGSAAYREYACAPSEQFAGFTWCQRRRNENSPRGAYASSNTILHSPEGTAYYINRYLEPAFFSGNEANEDVSRLSVKFGAPTILPIASRSDVATNGMIAYWGAVSLTQLEPELRRELAVGHDIKAGLLIDHIGNFQRSAQLGLPIYRLGGGSGFVWAASWGNDGRGTLRFLAIDASRLPRTAMLASETPTTRTDTFAEPPRASDPVTDSSSGKQASDYSKPQTAAPAQPHADAAAVADDDLRGGRGSKSFDPPSQPQEIAAAPALNPVPDASGAGQPESPTKPEVRVVGPPVAFAKSPAAEPTGSAPLVAFLVALIVVLLGVVAFLFKRTRPAPQGRMMEFTASAVAVPSAEQAPRIDDQVQNPIVGIELPALAAADRVSEPEPQPPSAAGVDPASGIETSTPGPAAVEIADHPRQPLLTFSANGWTWAAGAVLLSTLLLLPQGEAAWIPIALTAYLVPSIIAFRRNHVYAWVVLGLNLVFGLTGLVWLAMLIWSLTGGAKSVLDQMQTDGGTAVGPSGPGQAAISDRDLQSGWKIPVIEAELFAFDPARGPLTLSATDVKAYLKNTVVGLLLSEATGSVQYDVRTEVRCVTVLRAETKIRVGKTIGRSALTGLGAAIFSGRHAALGGAILDYRFAGDETEDVVSALIVFSDFSSLAFRCVAQEYEKFCALMPPDVLSEARAEETGEQLSRIQRMAEDGPRVLVEADEFIANARQQVDALTTQASTGATFADRDQARLALTEAKTALGDAEAVRKAVEARIAAPEAAWRLKSA